MTLPKQARDGIERVWIGILKERHPGYQWTIVREEDGAYKGVAADNPNPGRNAEKPGPSGERSSDDQHGYAVERRETP